MTVCTSLAQEASVPTVVATSQAGGGTQIPAARTLEQVMKGLQTPGAPPAHPIAAAQDHEVPAMTEDEQKRLERFGRLQPPFFSGAELEVAQDFLDKCQRTLHMVGILKTGRVSFTTF